MNKQIVMNEVVNNQDEVISISIFDVNFYKSLEDLNIKYKENGVVCFTGNRPTSLPWKYNEDCELCKEFKHRLKDVLLKCISFGYRRFITGMAMGFDIICAELILELKIEGNDIDLECAVPCLNQTRGWKNDYQIRYQNILDKANNVLFTSNYAYFDGCYMIRNRYMVDSADLVLGCQLKQSSGTKMTIQYAEKINKQLIVLI